MVAGHLRERNGIYQIVLSYIDENGKRHTPSKSTGLPIRGNKKRAEAMLLEARLAKEAELVQLAQEAEERAQLQTPESADIPFTEFLLDWLSMMQSNVEETSFAAYTISVKRKIVPYFECHHPGLLLSEVTPKHIQDYYTWEMRVQGVSANTVIHRHANIRKALQYAFKTGLLEYNPADRVDRPKRSNSLAASTTRQSWNNCFRRLKVIRWN